MQAYWRDSGETIDADTLRAQGVLYEALSTEEAAYQPRMDALKSERGYVEQDVVELHPDTPNLPEILEKFDDEHLHTEDEARFVLEGEGVFDIRSDGDAWMRVKVEKGDLIVVPAQRYHRFELTGSKTIRCVRLFQDRSGWVPHYRETI